MAIQRYKAVDSDGENALCMRCDTGDLVDYADHVAEVARLVRALRSMRNILKALEGQLAEALKGQDNGKT